MQVQYQWLVSWLLDSEVPDLISGLYLLMCDFFIISSLHSLWSQKVELKVLKKKKISYTVETCLSEITGLSESRIM